MAESIRAEASRRGISTYRVRVQRAEGRGFQGSEARRLGAGKPNVKAGELGLKMQRDIGAWKSSGDKGAAERVKADLQKIADRLGITVHEAWTRFVASPPKKRR